MKVKLEPVSVIEARLGIENGGHIHSFFTETCDRYMDGFVPYDPGHGGDHLRENKILGVDYIEYDMPYAHYQFFGIRDDGTHKINPDNYTTPGTGPHWDELMWNVYKEDVLSEVQKEIERYGR